MVLSVRRLRGETARSLARLWRLPGAGVVTGASDDDPSGIATYSVAGAQTGYSLLWTSLISLPLNVGVQEICARIGLVTGGGLASVLRRHYRRRLLVALVALLFVANTVNIGADIAAVAAGIDLLTGVPAGALVVPVAIAVSMTEVFVPYRVFAAYLKVLTLVLFAYVADAFVAAPDWGRAIRSTFVPRFELSASFVTTLVAILGTTISPYLFFWETSEEVEEMHRRGIEPGDEPELRRVQIDTSIGMLLANVVFYFIVLTTAATLYPAGIHEIATAREAAEALRPLAGDKATVLFAIGLVGDGIAGDSRVGWERRLRHRRSIRVARGAGEPTAGGAAVLRRHRGGDDHRHGDRAFRSGRDSGALRGGGGERRDLAGIDRGDRRGQQRRACAGQASERHRLEHSRRCDSGDYGVGGPRDGRDVRVRLRCVGRAGGPRCRGVRAALSLSRSHAPVAQRIER